MMNRQLKNLMFAAITFGDDRFGRLGGGVC